MEALQHPSAKHPLRDAPAIAASMVKFLKSCDVHCEKLFHQQQQQQKKWDLQVIQSFSTILFDLYKLAVDVLPYSPSTEAIAVKLADTVTTLVKSFESFIIGNLVRNTDFVSTQACLTSLLAIYRLCRTNFNGNQSVLLVVVAQQFAITFEKCVHALGARYESLIDEHSFDEAEECTTTIVKFEDEIGILKTAIPSITSSATSPSSAAKGGRVSSASAAAAGGGGGGGYSSLPQQPPSSSLPSSPPLPPPQSAAKVFDWSEFDLIASSSTSSSSSRMPPSSIIGNGSFGVVVRLVLHRKLGGTARFLRQQQVVDEIVAVKVMLQQQIGGATIEELTIAATREAEFASQTEQLLGRDNCDCVVRVYGVVKGVIPAKLATGFGMASNVKAVGIVMRLEAGGSLESLLYPAAGVAKTPLSSTEAMRVMGSLALGLAELHSVDVTHGDLKPANVLLSEHHPPIIRLGDFGESSVRVGGGSALVESSLKKTLSHRGTPLYNAPEMLDNVLDPNSDGSVAKPSRKTDMYSFACICGELLTNEKPFSEFPNLTENMLSRKVHQGARPSLAKASAQTPPSVLAMVERCWDKDRAQRLSAAECYAILNQAYLLSSASEYDIFFSHPWADKPLLSRVCLALRRKGYKVWYDQDHMGWDLVKSMKEGVARSKVVVACVNALYQSRPNCMLELLETAKLTPSKPVVTLFTQRNPFSWASPEIKKLCNTSGTLFLDIGALAEHDCWASDTGPSEQMTRDLARALEPLLKILMDIDCRPSY